MPDLFLAAVKVVLDDEGVLSNELGDPGGETKWGIARNRHPEITAEQWQAYTKDDAIALYRSGYWDAHRCGEMPWAWGLAVFDGQVNQGSVIMLAQRALGLPKIDGAVGLATLSAMKTAAREHLATFLALRIKSYIALPRFPYDGTGWVKRTIVTAIAGSTEPI